MDIQNIINGIAEQLQGTNALIQIQVEDQYYIRIIGDSSRLSKSSRAAAVPDTPGASSTNPFNPGAWSYNTDLTEKTIPITANTYLLLQVKSLSDDPALKQSSVTDWFDISFE